MTVRFEPFKFPFLLRCCYLPTNLILKMRMCFAKVMQDCTIAGNPYRELKISGEFFNGCNHLFCVLKQRQSAVFGTFG